MNDSAQWATSWLVALVGPGGPGMTSPVAVHDCQSAGLTPAQLHDQLRELRRPVADGVPKNGRYAVAYERRWDGRDAVWLEAAEYAFGMFGARLVFVQPARRAQSGALIADGSPTELSEEELLHASPPPLAVTARAVAGLARAGARHGISAVLRVRDARGRSLQARFAEESYSAHEAAGGDPEPDRPIGATGRRSVRERLTSVPTAVLVAVWVGMLLLGVVSAVSLTGLATSSRAVAKSRVLERAAGQAVNLRQAATGAPAPAANPKSAARPVPGDLGLPMPMSRPACDGGYGVIVANAVHPGAYEREVRQFLARFSGARYLLAEQACSSLRSHTGNGDSIYAVYYGPYPALGNACATRGRVGAGSYVRKLDNDGPSGPVIHC